MSDDQMDLFPSQARARRTDPETSHEAAASMTLDKLSAQRSLVYDVIRSFGPMTDPAMILAVHARYGKHRESPSGLRTRRSELVRLGLVKDSGEREKLESGRMAILWKVT